jgi:hypothetical protein
MKYEKMLCWVRPHEKKELKEAVAGRFPLVFAKNYEDFKAQITDDAYLVFSASRAKRLTALQKLLYLFPNNIFVVFGEGPEEEGVYKVSFLRNEPNVVKGRYSEFEIVDNFLGKISDLWEFRRVGNY